MLRSIELPPTWFARPQYRPRVERNGSRWFLLTDAARRVVSVEEALEHIPPLDRGGPAGSPLREVVESTGRRWGLRTGVGGNQPPETLGRPDTLVVVAGQQPGLLGGPLLTLYKAVSAVAIARRLARATARPCVPVFWVAGEDHDIDEVREARWPGAGGSETVIRLPHRPDRRPLSTIGADGDVLGALEEARTDLRRRRHGELAGELIDHYRGRSLAAGFARVLESLLAGQGLAIVDPEELRPFSKPIFRKIIEEPFEALARIEEGIGHLEQRGLEPFVAPRLPLFLLEEGRRHHLSPARGGLMVDGVGRLLERGELLEILERSPERFSSGALLRPIIQEALLPVALTVGGPAEVGYYGEIGPLAHWLGVRTPTISVRLQATLLEGRSARLFRRLELTPEGLATAGRPEDIVPPAPEPEALRETRSLRDRATAAFEALKAELPGDSAGRRIEKSMASAISLFDRIIERSERAVARSRADLFDAAAALWAHLFPGGALQERRWSFVYYVAKYGADWLDELIEEVEREPFAIRHRLFFFEED